MKSSITYTEEEWKGRKGKGGKGREEREGWKGKGGSTRGKLSIEEWNN